MNTGAKNLKLAILCSSNGGVLESLARVAVRNILPFSICGVITDRACGAENVAAAHSLRHERVIATTNREWSDSAATILRAWRPYVVLLLLHRKVYAPIWRDLGAHVWNLHPSLLPAYPGLKALERNFADAINATKHDSTIQMGVTLHKVNETIDGGPIIAQRRFTCHEAPTFEHASHLSYLLKLELVLDAMVELSAPDSYSLGFSSEPHLIAEFAQPWARSWLQSRRDDLTSPSLLRASA